MRARLLAWILGQSPSLQIGYGRRPTLRWVVTGNWQHAEVIP